jgi:hypothetical protein
MTYGELVRARKDCRLCVDGGPSPLRNGSSFDFDPDVVSHWSQWLGHQRPRLLVVGQDFSGADYFERNRGRDDPASPTNRSLRDLLAEACQSALNSFQGTAPKTFHFVRSVSAVFCAA